MFFNRRRIFFLTVSAVAVIITAALTVSACGEEPDPAPCASAELPGFISQDESEEDCIGGDEYDGLLSIPGNVRLDRLAITAEVTAPLESARVSSLFGYRENPVTGKYRFHTGYDLAAPAGSPIRAMLAGAVTTAGYDSGYGNYVILDHGGGLQTLYAHCSKLLTARGDTVAQGQVIAEVGSTGNSTGAHLHVEFRRDGQRYDPEWILGGIYG